MNSLNTSNSSYVSIATTPYSTTIDTSPFYTSLTTTTISFEVDNVASIFSSESIVLFWLCFIYSIPIFIWALLYFLFETYPQYKKTWTSSLREIWTESAKHSTLNNQQYIMDIIDIITEIMNLINIIVVFYDKYPICGIFTCIGSGLLLFLVYAKTMFLKHSSLNNKIFNNMIMFDLFTASSSNAIQGIVAFYILYQNQIKWNVIIYIKVIVVGYLMAMKLCRAALLCITMKKYHYDAVTEVIAIKNNPNPNEKVMSYESRSNEQNTSSLEMEPPSPDSINIVLNDKQIEESDESKESKENKENEENIDDNDDKAKEAKKILSDINNFGDIDGTKELLLNLSKNDDLGNEYKHEWIKCVIQLIDENQKKLRNMAMKPVVKQYIKSLEKNKNGQDYQKFMALLSNKQNQENRL